MVETRKRLKIQNFLSSIFLFFLEQFVAFNHLRAISMDWKCKLPTRNMLCCCSCWPIDDVESTQVKRLISNCGHSHAWHSLLIERWNGFESIKWNINWSKWFISECDTARVAIFHNSPETNWFSIFKGHEWWWWKGWKKKTNQCDGVLVFDGF